MSKKPWHPRYHADALQGYMRLTLEERGAYTTLLDLIYDRGGRIEHDERWLAGWCGCSIRKVRSLISSLAEKGKITVHADGYLSNARAEKEIASQAELSRKQAENALKTTRKRAENQTKTPRNEVENVVEFKKNSQLCDDERPPARGLSQSQSQQDTSVSCESGARARASPSSDLSRVPENLIEDARFTEAARAKGFDDDVAAEQLEQFTAYWSDRADRREKAARKSGRGWLAAWRNWLDRVDDRKRRPPDRGAESWVDSGARQHRVIAEAIGRSVIIDCDG